MARRERTRGSTLGAVLGLGVLASVAFVAGGVAGLLWKEPGLLVAYLRGDTTEIALSTAAADLAAVDTPPVAALAEPRKKESEKIVTPPMVAAKSVDRPAVAAPPPSARPAPAPRSAARRAEEPESIAIQVGAFGERKVADGLRKRLRDAGFPAYLAAAARAGDPWRVRVGPYGTRGEAEQIASRLKLAEKLPTWVLDENAAP
ncbi:MAG: SPOR domain-containing protein [Proteobacteria bacterium]|nr:SPOR domain-containing protein [Pseudomonadota bacterium]